MDAPPLLFRFDVPVPRLATALDGEDDFVLLCSENERDRYTVIPIQKDAVTEGLESLVDPENLDSSPSGWVTTSATAGNNVVAFKSSQSAR
ncbi:hypothetical protein BDZ89DRAFT_1146020 [Hymenopellis radicata]|nr:hypothetical protein BDZ89DRAFT_1146020 [Hymenopellis radicata]